MNLALVASSLQTKYLNQIFVVDRGSYENVPVLFAAVIGSGLCVPLVAIFWFGHKLSGAEIGGRR